MRLGCADFSFRLVEHEAALDLIKAIGFDGVDVAGIANRPVASADDFLADVDGWIERLCGRLSSRGLEASDVFLIAWTDNVRTAPNNPDPAERRRSAELFAAACDLTAALGSSGMSMLPGRAWPTEVWQTSFERSVEELGWRVADAASKGLRLSIEPAYGSIADTPERTLGLLAAVPGLELTLDYSHFVYQAITEEAIEPLLAHTRHVHARGARPGRVQAPLHESTIDFGRIVALLRRQGYTGWISTEYVWLRGDPPGSVYDMTATDTVAETVLLRERLLEEIGGS